MTSLASLSEELTKQYQRILASIDQQEWQQVAELQEQREAFIRKQFEKALQDHTLEDMAALIELATQQDQAIKLKVTQSQADLRQAMSKQQKSNKAIKSYNEG